MENGMPTRDINPTVHEGLRLSGDREHEDAPKLEPLREAIRIGEEAIERGEYRDVGLDGLKGYLAELAEAGAPAPQTIMTNKPAAARGAGRSRHHRLTAAHRLSRAP